MRALSALRPRPLRALQVEVTTRCTRRCAVCPRRALAERWHDRDLGAAHWEAVAPFLDRVQHVHLQGWGEPLLHPRLPDMVAVAKRAGCAVGITTNGDLLPGAVKWLVDLGVDVVTVSLAGGPERHARLRDGSVLETALAAARELVGRGRRGRPRVQLGYLVTRDNAADLGRLVGLAAKCGVHEVYATHLDCTPTAELLDAAGFSESGARAEVRAAFAEARACAADLGVRLRLPAVDPEDVLVCELDPITMAFVSADGRVGPCVYLLLPIDGPVPRADWGRQHHVEPVVYGSLADAPLEEVLRSDVRRRFVASFEVRLAAERQFLERIRGGFGTTALSELDAADEARCRAFADNPMPAACRGCHKTSGW